MTAFDAAERDVKRALKLRAVCINDGMGFDLQGLLPSRARVGACWVNIVTFPTQQPTMPWWAALCSFQQALTDEQLRSLGACNNNDDEGDGA